MRLPKLRRKDDILDEFELLEEPVAVERELAPDRCGEERPTGGRLW